MAKRREYTPEYKAKLIIEVLREEKTMSEIAAREEIGLNQLSNWKSEFMSNADRVFGKSREEKAAARQLDDMKEMEKAYQAKVGQLTLENDFLKEVYKKLHGQEWEARNGLKK